MSDHMTRRTVLRRGLQLPMSGGLLLGLSACGQQAEDTLVCADVSSMTSAQASVRRTLNYVEQAADVAQSCSGCDFFKAAGSCGSCEIFGGEAVNPSGHCDSWSQDS